MFAWSQMEWNKLEMCVCVREKINILSRNEDISILIQLHLSGNLFINYIVDYIMCISTFLMQSTRNYDKVNMGTKF